MQRTSGWQAAALTLNARAAPFSPQSALAVNSAEEASSTPAPADPPVKPASSTSAASQTEGTPYEPWVEETRLRDQWHRVGPAHAEETLAVNVAQAAIEVHLRDLLGFFFESWRSASCETARASTVIQGAWRNARRKHQVSPRSHVQCGKKARKTEAKTISDDEYLEHAFAQAEKCDETTPKVTALANSPGKVGSPLGSSGLPVKTQGGGDDQGKHREGALGDAFFSEALEAAGANHMQAELAPAKAKYATEISNRIAAGLNYKPALELQIRSLENSAENNAERDDLTDKLNNFDSQLEMLRAEHLLLDAPAAVCSTERGKDVGPNDADAQHCQET